jgi:hypothetical protein
VLSIVKKGPKPSRSDSDNPPPSDFPGLERLDRPELDEEAPDTLRDDRDDWQEDSAVRQLVGDCA